jgi:hypothetical protein
VQARNVWAGVKLGLSISFFLLEFQAKSQELGVCTKIYDKELESIWGKIIVVYFMVMSGKATHNHGNYRHCRVSQCQIQILTFMGSCLVRKCVFQYISNKMQRYTVYLYLENALHVLGGTSIHHQERIQLYLQHMIFVTPLLLSAAILGELRLPVPTFHDSGR